MSLTATPNGSHASAWTGSRLGATDTIAKLTAQGAFGREGRIGELVSTASWRIDRQKNIAGIADMPGKSNLQLQKNNADRPSTLACLIVPDRYFFDIAGPDAANREAELTRILRHGLNSSLASWVDDSQSGLRRTT